MSADLMSWHIDTTQQPDWPYATDEDVSLFDELFQTHVNATMSAACTLPLTQGGSSE